MSQDAEQLSSKVADLNVNVASEQKPVDVEKKKKNLLKKLRAIDDLQKKVWGGIGYDSNINFPIFSTVFNVVEKY